MNRLERLFAITEVIRRSGRQPVSAARLADRFDVSTRTIERDLASLREAGTPLVSEPGRLGGTVSLDSAAGVVVTLSTTQVTALLIAVAVGTDDMPFSADAAEGAEMLLERLPANTRATVEELRSRVRSQAITATVGPRIRRTLEEAVRRGVIVNITYCDAASTTTERAVEAIGFYHGSDGWYLNGWCTLRDAGRIFRLDRIQRAHLTRRAIQDRDVDDVLGWLPTEVTAP